MATIADDLEADFADLSDDGEQEQEQGEDEQMGSPEADGTTSTTHDMDAALQDLLKRIETYQSAGTTQPDQSSGEDEQYDTFAQSTTFSTTIGDRMAQVHKYIRDHYSTRFPELETLLVDPMQYSKTVGIIGNGPMDRLQPEVSDNVIKTSLQQVLSRPQLMTVTVEATTTKGQPLPSQELQAVQDACVTMVRLEAAKRTLTHYVESRLAFFAPNLTALIGSDTAAHLLNARGGLTALANTRASNIPSIGTKHFTQSGLATNAGVRNKGYLYDAQLIQRFRPELRIQAMRITSAKLVLAARCDLQRSTPDGSLGEDLREQCEKRLDKLIEPPPNRGHRALPAPDEKPSRKRGGRRARKAKEAVALTDIRKAQNRMAFGKEEQETGYGAGDSTKGLGMIGQQNDNRIRALQVDNRTRAKLSKKNQGWGGASTVGGATTSLGKFGASGAAGNASVLKGHGLRTSGVGTSMNPTAGTASSLAFTPQQGLELVDPKVRADIERKNKAEADRYFKSGTFTQIGGNSSQSSGAAKQQDGFKVPSLPIKRQANGT
ncbi:MAG: U4/U6-U5 snRNP complex subunit prp31 [Chrysothrix sp. TS-e1954]|nr:MAG: U4/U6-U5 snRNP complex subunit prp31 [Chrysothrix sp. TS-e1954]